MKDGENLIRLRGLEELIERAFLDVLDIPISLIFQQKIWKIKRSNNRVSNEYPKNIIDITVYNGNNWYLNLCKWKLRN